MFVGGLSNGVANAGVMRPRLILPANFRSLSPNATVRVHPQGSVPYVLFRPPQVRYPLCFLNALDSISEQMYSVWSIFV